MMMDNVNQVQVFKRTSRRKRTRTRKKRKMTKMSSRDRPALWCLNRRWNRCQFLSRILQLSCLKLHVYWFSAVFAMFATMCIIKSLRAWRPTSSMPMKEVMSWLLRRWPRYLGIISGQTLSYCYFVCDCLLVGMVLFCVSPCFWGWSDTYFLTVSKSGGTSLDLAGRPKQPPSCRNPWANLWSRSWFNGCNKMLRAGEIETWIQNMASI